MQTESNRMSEPEQDALFPTPKPTDADRQRDPTTGLLPSQMLREAVALGREILSPQPIGDDQIQPASIDLRLGEVAYRVRARFLPGAKASVRDKLDLLSMHRIDLTQGAVLEKDCVYIVPLCEYVALRSRTSGFANPKSSIGRLDVCRAITLCLWFAVYDEARIFIFGCIAEAVCRRTRRGPCRLCQLADEFSKAIDLAT